MSDTPRTDALLDPVKGTVAFTGFCAEHARTLERENAAMREAIREAHESIDLLITVASGGMQPANGKLSAIKNGRTTLSKLQPFLKP